MKIILVVADSKGKNVVFVSDTLQVYQLDDAARLANAGKFENVYAVQRRSGAYLRASRSVPKKEQLEQLSVSSRQLFVFADNFQHALSTPAVAPYLQLYQHSLEAEGGPYIIIGGHRKITKRAAREKLQAHKELIFEAAKKFNVDPYLLGAVIIDEIAQFAFWEPITDPLLGYFVGVNASAGIAQVKIDTARGLIEGGYYNPDPNNQKLAPKAIRKTLRMDLYEYVKQPKHNIRFAAARMRVLTDKWKKFVDLSARPEIIATLYHLPHKDPHRNPEANERGLQIANEFYRLAREWLR